MAFDLIMIALATGIAFGVNAFGAPLTVWLPPFIAALGILFTRRTAHEQRVLAERKLYLDLVARRSKWLDDFRSTMDAAIEEMAANAERLIQNEQPSDTPNRDKLTTLTTEARWLYDEDVKFILDDLGEALDSLYGARVDYRFAQENDLEEDEFPHEEVRTRHADTVGFLLSASAELNVALTPYLFVGDIKRDLAPSFVEKVKSRWALRAVKKRMKELETPLSK